MDTATDFTAAASGDVLDISDLLVNAPPLTIANVGNYLAIHSSGGSSTISIDRDGTGGDYGFQGFVVLQGVTGLNLTTCSATATSAGRRKTAT